MKPKFPSDLPLAFSIGAIFSFQNQYYLTMNTSGQSRTIKLTETANLT